jgi:rhodanese-related sulfurtransferase
MMAESIFSVCKLHINGIPHPLPAEVLDLLRKGAVLVDLRDPLETEIRAFGVEKIIYLSHTEFEEKWETLPADKPLILADSVGIWSKKEAQFLQSKGYQEVASLAGGIADWEKDGFPVNAGRYQPLNGPCPCMIKPHENK